MNRGGGGATVGKYSIVTLKCIVWCFWTRRLGKRILDEGQGGRLECKMATLGAPSAV